MPDEEYNAGFCKSVTSMHQDESRIDPVDAIGIPDDVRDTILDSGDRTEFPTGSVRDRQAGKGRHDILMFHAIDELAKHCEGGIEKYGEDNWRLGQPLRQYLASAFRHLFKLLAGSKDENHARGLLWNAAAFIETRYMIKLGILPEDLNDLRDYTTPEGFDRTVRQPALQEARKRSSKVEYGGGCNLTATQMQIIAESGYDPDDFEGE